ncbi:MAG: PDZ domain-containing protein [Acidobacteria bacterium]|nr:PDZ domain-containing protein [Acidobacteriota bacterium]
MKRTILSVAAAGLLATAPYASAWQSPAPAQAPKAAERAVVVMTGSRSFLGVGVVEVTSERTKVLKLSEERGVEITKVEENTPAEKAGLKVGDVVTEYNGQRVEGTEQFIRFVRETPAGRNVKLTVIRNGNSQVLTAMIEARKAKAWESGEFSMPAIPNIPQMLEIPRPIMGWRTGALGIEAEAVSAQLAEFFGVKQGVLVRSVSKDSSAEKAGIKAGDVITKVDDKAVASPSDVTRAIGQSKDKSLAVTVIRDRKEMSLNVKIEDTRTPRGRAARLEQQRF